MHWPEVAQSFYAVKNTHPRYGWDFPGKVPEKTERPRNRTHSVSWNSPRKHGWDALGPTIQCLSPQYVWGRSAVQKWFRRGPLRAPILELPAILGVCLRLTLAREREKRERQRERQRREEKRKDEGEGGRPGQREQKRKSNMTCASCARPDLPRRGPVLQAQSKGSKEENPSRPQEEKRGKKKEKEERGRKTEPETGPPKTPEPENGDKTPYIMYRIPYKPRTPHQTKPHPRQITEFAAQNPPEKRSVTKIELRKNKPQKRRTFCRRFRDEKQGFLGPKIFPKKPRTPRSELVVKNSPAKNLRHTEL